jgi:heme-degrading monooxygenase HmoA
MEILMFLAVYRYTLKPGTEAQFASDWAEVTQRGITEGRSLGSTLGKAQDGSWVAVARWLSKQQRDDWFASIPVDGARARMREAIDQWIDDLEVEIVNDITAVR